MAVWKLGVDMFARSTPVLPRADQTQVGISHRSRYRTPFVFSAEDPTLWWSHLFRTFSVCFSLVLTCSCYRFMCLMEDANMCPARAALGRGSQPFSPHKRSPSLHQREKSGGRRHRLRHLREYDDHAVGSFSSNLDVLFICHASLQNNHHEPGICCISFVCAIESEDEFIQETIGSDWAKLVIHKTLWLYVFVHNSTLLRSLRRLIQWTLCRMAAQLSLHHQSRLFLQAHPW